MRKSRFIDPCTDAVNQAEQLCADLQVDIAPNLATIGDCVATLKHELKVPNATTPGFRNARQQDDSGDPQDALNTIAIRLRRVDGSFERALALLNERRATVAELLAQI